MQEKKESSLKKNDLDKFYKARHDNVEICWATPSHFDKKFNIHPRISHAAIKSLITKTTVNIGYFANYTKLQNLPESISCIGLTKNYYLMLTRYCKDIESQKASLASLCHFLPLTVKWIDLTGLHRHLLTMLKEENTFLTAIPKRFTVYYAPLNYRYARCCDGELAEIRLKDQYQVWQRPVSCQDQDVFVGEKRKRDSDSDFSNQQTKQRNTKKRGKSQEPDFKNFQLSWQLPAQKLLPPLGLSDDIMPSISEHSFFASKRLPEVCPARPKADYNAHFKLFHQPLHLFVSSETVPTSLDESINNNVI